MCNCWKAPIAKYAEEFLQASGLLINIHNPMSQQNCLLQALLAHINTDLTVGYDRFTDTEAGVLPGVTRQHNMRSNLYWFSEFCNSQWISHFAAPFIVIWTETSVAESCLSRFIFWNNCLENKINIQWQQGTKGKTPLLYHPRVCCMRLVLLSNNISHPVLTPTMHRICLTFVRMILPQVHLRKPCYDFSFL